MDFFNALVYFCGLIGCAAVPLVPLRSFAIIVFARNTSRKIFLVIAILASLAVFLYEIRALLRIYNCMTEASCTYPGIRMWMYLTMFGTVYLTFEFVFFVVRKINVSLIQKSTNARQQKQCK